jgi:hypothetical protein
MIVKEARQEQRFDDPDPESAHCQQRRTGVPGNNGCAARIFSALPVSTVISARRVRRSPGSPQATDASGAELALAWCQQPGCRAG